ncbi:CdaR family protein [Maribacter sp. 2307ULW6-5]|uniref:CdaR family protein n=1 Tax=Maribacter sp. 2307ULW6-5 TaxID=3386275 RepID=UPI0039BC41D4
MIERIKVGLGKRKVQVFLVFLSFSALSWFVNSLGKTYVGNSSFGIQYVNVPNAFRLAEMPKEDIQVRLETVGFQFLGLSLRKRMLQLDLSQTSKKDSMYFLAPLVYKRQIENQLPASIRLLDVERDTLFFDLTKIVSKWVPVVPRVSYQLAPNHTLKDGLVVYPDRVEVSGPSSEIDTIAQLQTSPLDLGTIKSDFSTSLPLAKAEGLTFTTLSPNSVTVSGRVFRFSERVLSVPITPVNVPDSLEMILVPKKVELVCQGKLEDLEAVAASSFRVLADYQLAKERTDATTRLVLENWPTVLSHVRLQTDEAAFIIKKRP